MMNVCTTLVLVHEASNCSQLLAALQFMCVCVCVLYDFWYKFLVQCVFLHRILIFENSFISRRQDFLIGFTSFVQQFYA